MSVRKMPMRLTVGALRAGRGIGSSMRGAWMRSPSWTRTPSFLTPAPHSATLPAVGIGAVRDWLYAPVSRSPGLPRGHEGPMVPDPAQSPDLACLVPLTPEARRAAAAPVVPLHRFPFRVGRDLRDPDRKPRLLLRERRRGTTSGPNDLYLLELGPRLRLSREHFLIGEEGGRYFLEDRRSSLGTLVEGRIVGGARTGGRCELRDGDVIIPGGSGSHFVFKFARRPPAFHPGAALDPTVLRD